MDRVRRAALCGCVIALAAAGCSSSGGAESSSTSNTASTSNAGKQAPAGVARAVSHAYAVFFGSTSTAAQSEAVLQHGASFRQALAAEGKSSYADKSAAKVSRVSLASDHVADVTFTVLDNGKPLLSNTQGKAVLDGGAWKVAAVTFCGLLQLEGTAPTACKDPKIIGLPE